MVVLSNFRLKQANESIGDPRGSIFTNDLNENVYWRSALPHIILQIHLILFVIAENFSPLSILFLTFSLNIRSFVRKLTKYSCCS